MIKQKELKLYSTIFWTFSLSCKSIEVGYLIVKKIKATESMYDIEICENGLLIPTVKKEAMTLWTK